MFDHELLETDDQGRPLADESHAFAEEAFDNLLMKLRKSAVETAKCALPICRKQVGADDFLCAEHWQYVPEPMRADYHEVHMMGADADRPFLRTAVAYVQLALEKKGRNA